jgi:hypothetical protein
LESTRSGAREREDNGRGQRPHDRATDWALTSQDGGVRWDGREPRETERKEWENMRARCCL